jgi:ElaB/YqjD/DUF883 family membrane-anchored ribosome-binding protein
MTKTSSTNKKATSPAKKATSRKIKPKVDKKDAAKKRAHTGVQAHGHEWEDDLIAVFVSPSNMDAMNNLSYTSIHDIPKEFNQLTGRNVSVKAVDNMSKNSPLEAVIIQYTQEGDQKIPSRVTRLNLTDSKSALFGTDNMDEMKTDIQELDRMVKTGDPQYKQKAADIRSKYPNSHMKVAPKIGNIEKKRAGRLQISLANIDKLVKEHPHIVIDDEHCDPIKGCLRTLQSSIRTIGKKPVAESDKEF